MLKTGVLRYEGYLSCIYLHALEERVSVSWKAGLHNPPLREISTWLRLTKHFTFTSYIPQNQHPRLLTPPHLSKSGLSLHFSFSLSRSSAIHLHLSKTYPYLALPLSFFILLECMIASGCIQSYVCDLIQLLNSLLPTLEGCPAF